MYIYLGWFESQTYVVCPTYIFRMFGDICHPDNEFQAGRRAEGMGRWESTAEGRADVAMNLSRCQKNQSVDLLAR